MNKIYIVTAYIPDFDTVDILFFCSSAEIATKKKKELEEKIKDLEQQYNGNYEEDLYKYHFGGYDNEPFPDDYEEIADRIILYQAKHEELRYSEINIEEKDLL